MKVLQLQTHVYKKKAKNLEELRRLLVANDDEHPDLVTLGEMFDCPYETSNFSEYAEHDRGAVWLTLSRLASEHHVYLAAGSVPEEDDEGRIYNTAYVFDRSGRQIAKHRKMHLFDIDVEGGQKFKESDTLSAGDGVTVFDTEFGRMGLCVCFDFRFPELARLMVLKGAKAIIVPAAFNTTTGPAHWETMFRGRAIDNQCYVIGTSPARDDSFSYHAWGHSIIVSPWGTVVDEMDEKEGQAINDIDLSYVDKVRKELPLLTSRRLDVYRLIETPEPKK
jgi:omega-amidase